jgi:tetratricopeptide (TPR) repeat protein
MNRNSKQIVLSVAVLALGFAMIFVLSNFLEKNRPALPEALSDSDLALQGSRMKGFTLGFEGLIADWYWTQSLQYIGDKLIKHNETGTEVNLENLKPLNPRLLYPLLDNATDLDPKFMAAYSYGAVVLPAVDPEQAIKLTEKGIRENPSEWRLYQHLGYIYWRLGNFDKASEVYAEGAKVAGAPPFFKLMSATMKTEGGSRDTARSMYQQMLSDAQDNETKQIAELRLMQLESLDERDAIQNVLKEFKEKNNRCANSWGEIFPLLRNVKLPGGRDFRIDKSNNIVDPTGVPYLLEKQTCEVRLDPKVSKIPVE